MVKFSWGENGLAERVKANPKILTVHFSTGILIAQNLITTPQTTRATTIDIFEHWYLTVSLLLL